MWRSLIVTLACVVVIEVLVGLTKGSTREIAENVADSKAIQDSRVYWKYRLLLTPSPSPENYPVVLLGDSSCLMGLIPDAFKHATGLPTMNLATNGAATLDVQNDILELHIAKHGPPKLAVLHMSEHVLCHCKLADFAEFRGQILDWSAEMRGASPFEWGRPWEILPSVRNRRSLIRDIRKLWSSSESQPRADERFGRMFAETMGYEEYPAEVAKHRHPDDIRLVQDWLPMLQRLFHLARRHDFEIMMVMSPITASQAGPERLLAHERLFEDLRVFAAEYPRVTVQRAGFVRVFPDELTGDGTHLARAGAERNSREVAELAYRQLNLRSLTGSQELGTGNATRR